MDKDMPHDMRRARSLTRMHMHSVDVHVNCDVWCVVHHMHVRMRAHSLLVPRSLVYVTAVFTHTRPYLVSPIGVIKPLPSNHRHEV